MCSASLWLLEVLEQYLGVGPPLHRGPGANCPFCPLLGGPASQKHLVRGFEYTCPTLKVTTELQELITYVSHLYIRWKLEGFNCASYRNCAISRLRTGAAQSRDSVNPVRNLEIGTQFRDSENALRNLEIAQIPKLRGTYTFTLGCSQMFRQAQCPGRPHGYTSE